MTEAAAWRWRWLIEARFGLARLAASRAPAGDSRLIRSMQSELRHARCAIRALATLEADTADLAAVPEVGPSAAPAVALRLRGASLRAAAAAGATTPGRLAAILERLAQAVGAGGSSAAPGGSDPASGSAPPSDTPSAPATAAEATPACGQDPSAEDRASAGGVWVHMIGRTRDAAWTLRRIGLAVAGGRLPAGVAAHLLWAHGPRGGGYVRVHGPGAAPGLWTGLAACGLRPVGPAASG